MSQLARTGTETRSIVLEGNELTFVLRRSARARRITLRVKSSGLELVLPLRVSEKAGLQLIRSKSQWVLHHVSRLKQSAEARALEAEERKGFVLFQGRWLRIVESSAQGHCAVVVGDEIHVRSGENPQLWPKTQARRIIGECVARRAGSMRTQPKKLILRDNKTNWGTCSRIGNIGLNWRLVMAPPEVLDAIVVHELAHMFEPNHSKRFYEIVEKHCPEYKTHAKWLKVNGWQLRV